MSKPNKSSHIEEKGPIVKVLNLYAGIGGNRGLWPDNVKVTAVEDNEKVMRVYEENFPNDNTIRGDAHETLLDAIKHNWEYDFIWSSPPCQTHSMMNKGTRHNTIRYPDMRLYEEILLLSSFFRGKWAVENVNPHYKPLIKPHKVGRHLIWSNFHISNIRIRSPGLYAKKEDYLNWLGLKCNDNIYLDGNHCEVQVLRNCVHPKIGLHVFNAAFKDKQKGVNDYAK